jgi:hypothetical protein
MSYQGPGRYRHYKGNEYEVIGLAIMEESLLRHNDLKGADVEVVYQPTGPSLLDNSPASFWTRPLHVFNMEVERKSDGIKVKRFEKLDD